MAAVDNGRGKVCAHELYKNEIYRAQRDPVKSHDHTEASGKRIHQRDLERGILIVYHVSKTKGIINLFVIREGLAILKVVQ